MQDFVLKSRYPQDLTLGQEEQPGSAGFYVTQFSLGVTNIPVYY
jgi:hypothetical protein